MSLAAIGMGIGSLASLYQLGSGMVQTSRGRKMLESAERPEYNIPASQTKALSIAYDMLNRDMPGYNQAIDQQMLVQQNTMANASAAGNPLAVLPASQAVASNAIQNANVQNAGFKAQSAGALRQELARMAEFEDMKYQMNEFAPYAEQVQEARDLIGAGNKNVSGALQGFGSMSSLALMMGGNRQRPINQPAPAQQPYNGPTGGPDTLNMIPPVSFFPQPNAQTVNLPSPDGSWQAPSYTWP